jgi:hypothetical protein
VTPMHLCSSDGKTEPAGPRDAPHQGAPVGPVHGGEKVMWHGIHGGRGGGKTKEHRAMAYHEEEPTALGTDKWLANPFIGMRRVTDWWSDASTRGRCIAWWCAVSDALTQERLRRGVAGLKTTPVRMALSRCPLSERALAQGRSRSQRTSTVR